MDEDYAKGGKIDIERKRKSESLRNHSFRHADIAERNKRRNIDNESATPETLYRMLCPVNKIGSVLGKGGNIVSAIRDETGAKVRVADKVPGTDERVIIIFNFPTSELALQYQSHDPDANTDKEVMDMKPHCPAQAALLKIYDRILEDDQADKGHEVENADADDLTIRLLVPNNQVGCLIGKAGDVIQKLRSGTGANIRISGEEHLPPSALKSDELVQISGKSVVVKKALYEISTRLHQHPRKENPPIDDIIAASSHGGYASGASLEPMLPHRTSMWPHEDSAPYLAPPGSFFGSYRSDLSRRVDDYGMVEEFSVKVVCPSGKVGGVIGKGGSNVRLVERQTGAHIHIEDIADSEIRTILISSKEALLDRTSPTVVAVLQLQERVSEISDNGDITTRLLVPSSKAGCLLGQGGQVINEMRRQTRADIRVYAKADKPSYASQNEELVQITGNQRSARDALREVVSRLRERTLRTGNPVAHYPPTGVSRAPTAGGYRNPNLKGFGSKLEDKYYGEPPPVSGYPDFYSPVDARYHSSAVSSAFGAGADGLSDIRPDYESRAKLYDPLSRSADYSSDVYGPSEGRGASWSRHGGYEGRGEDPWSSYTSRSYRSFGRD